MTKKEWNALQIEYIKAYAKTGISIMDWCKKKGLNPASAKRYIKKPETAFAQLDENKQKEVKEKVKAGLKADIEKAKKRTAKQIAKSQSKLETQQIESKEDLEEKCEDDCANNREVASETAKTANVAKQTAKILGGRPIVHGGYARFFKDKSNFDVVKDFSLENEIDLMRQRAISAIESIERFTADLEKCTTAEDREITFKLVKSAEAALDRAVARIESLNNTNKNIALTLETIEFRKAQTQETLLKADKLKQELFTKSSARNAVLFNLEL
ncbi:terminase [Aggregatibacter actinomycetemcomitans]|uniref:terminase n=1 Tax=Aggregatibacter actinomycetemcomitans TaxID=714 RepID=UPI00197B35E9|nr:terminase [Aggregatibacter actinomycetemcomitans]MBN6067392.1 terminase [Aggregatibacter actinomycetemcomitans]MBN6086106.1 terminase [Aggregatibacter actinomycetemcomitans]